MERQKLPISLVMIVKNEEKYLAGCLDSVADFVAEMIVLDTGSTDSTKEIAQNKGAKVFDYVWKDDFADARNAALDYASYPWILQLDADEEIFREDISWFYESYPWHPNEGYWMYIYNYRENSPSMEAHPLIRFFRRHPESRYKYAVHENLMLRGNKAAVSGARIFHKGYASEALDKEKGERNLTLIKKRLKEEPDNPLSHFYFAQHYASLKDFIKAAAPARKSLKMGLGMPIKIMAIRICLIAALLENRPDKFADILEEAPDADIFPDRLLYEYFLIKNTQPELARQTLEVYLAKIEKDIASGHFGKVERSTPQNYVQGLSEFANLKETEGDFETALSLIETALKYSGQNFDLLASKAKLLLLTGNTSEAKSTTSELIKEVEAMPNQPSELLNKYKGFEKKLADKFS